MGPEDSKSKKVLSLLDPPFLFWPSISPATTSPLSLLLLVNTTLLPLLLLSLRWRFGAGLEDTVFVNNIAALSEKFGYKHLFVMHLFIHIFYYV